MNARWLALGALALGTLTIGLDTTVLTVAVPTMAVDLQASTSQLQWIANAYTLVLAGIVLPAGMLGDRYGRKRLLVGALVVFGLASLACAFAGDAGTLIAARTALGVGAAFMMPLSMAVLPVMFTKDELSKALTVWVTSVALGLPLGPILGGWLLDNYWWGSVFLINVPLIALAVLAVVFLVPESRSDEPVRIDVRGTLLSSVALLALTYGVIRVGDHDFSDATALVCLAIAVVTGVVFVRSQRRPDALVDLGLFRSRSFAWGATLSTLVNFSMFGLMFTVPQFFQSVGGADALGAGLRLLPMIGGLLVGARVGEKAVARFGPRVIIAFGYLLIAGGLAIGATSSVHSGFGFIATWTALMGAGLGFAMPAAMNAALGALPASRSGSGSSLITALRQAGGTIGIAVLGTILNSGYRDHLDTAGLPPAVADAARDSVNSAVAVAKQAPALLDSARGAFVHGMDSMLLVCAAISLLGVFAAAVFMPGRGAVEPKPVGTEESKDGAAVG
ncbi:MFS transporter [Labedaea rhizosphaerae]|uniref:EmrB/QacA subfamily drug resistance transporter n=1 Tax=Labedaea rhizosphaerae TaxID=598644 RepID=A0A4R6SLS6_LABRH|nr:MFS transporter [Labedaea rhizosphaerae]TDQ04834.1 EmrB/QacA subfamily drug resistance transporter [Labedaea rhizosphaerae]